jgi:CRP-like cAMP-binding protein
LEAAQFFGEGCLNGQAVRVGTARAMEECVVTSITRKAMLAALRKEPRFSELFVTYLVTRSNRIEEDLVDQLFNSSRSGWHAFFFCSPISEKMEGQHLSMFRSIRQRWRR